MLADCEKAMQQIGNGTESYESETRGVPSGFNPRMKIRMIDL